MFEEALDRVSARCVRVECLGKGRSARSAGDPLAFMREEVATLSPIQQPRCLVHSGSRPSCLGFETRAFTKQEVKTAEVFALSTVPCTHPNAQSS